jgi:hypothetical protein
MHRQLGDGPVAPDCRHRHLRLERRAVLLPCPLHVLLPRYPRFLGAGLHFSHLSHFPGPAQMADLISNLDIRSSMAICFLLWHPTAGVPGGRQSCLRPRPTLPGSTSQGALARHPPLPTGGGVRRPRSVPSPARPFGTAAVGLAMKPVGKPDAGNPHVRFDERGRETERHAATALVLDSTSMWDLREAAAVAR